MMAPAKIAGALSIIETGIGVRPDQMGAWRNFTGALIAFVEASQPPFMGGPGGPGAPGGVRMMPNANAPQPGNPPAPGPRANGQPSAADNGGPAAVGQDNAKARAFRFLDRFADRAIDRGEKAKALKNAIGQLQNVLTDEQVQTARGLVRSMMMEARARHGGWHHHHHGWGRGEKMGPGDGMRPDRMGPHHMGPGDDMGPAMGPHHGMGPGPQGPDDDDGFGPDNG
ncbi:hypothetical protein [Jiella sp. M17.18]|uniref:hypothetical protein n=1 Tax=Jiella sp. M17.18 TaxID=3234247 RepID=UPI0034DE9AAE